jgi:prevent-host-death family protein
LKKLANNAIILLAKGDDRVIVNATEFKNQVGRYMIIAGKEDVIITRNGKQVAKLIAIDKDETPITRRISGVLKHTTTIDLDTERDERLKRL